MVFLLMECLAGIFFLLSKKQYDFSVLSLCPEQLFILGKINSPSFGFIFYHERSLFIK